MEPCSPSTGNCGTRRFEAACRSTPSPPTAAMSARTCGSSPSGASGPRRRLADASAFAAGLRTRPRTVLARGPPGGPGCSPRRGFTGFCSTRVWSAPTWPPTPNRPASACRRPSPWRRRPCWPPRTVTTRALRDKASNLRDRRPHFRGIRRTWTTSSPAGVRQRTVRLFEGRQAAHRAVGVVTAPPGRLPGARPADAHRARPGHPGVVPRRARRAAVPTERVADRAGPRPPGAAGRDDFAAHVPALVRHPSVGGWGRRAGRAGTARASRWPPRRSTPWSRPMLRGHVHHGAFRGPAEAGCAKRAACFPGAAARPVRIDTPPHR